MEQVKNSKLKISIVTAAYNAAATVRRTVESGLGQTYDNIEYIVVDGKSSDDTVKIVEEYRDKFEQKGYTLTVVSERDNGIYDAMNKGITLRNDKRRRLVRTRRGANGCGNLRRKAFRLFLRQP